MFNMRSFVELKMRFQKIMVLTLLLIVVVACSNESQEKSIKLVDGSIYTGEIKNGVLHGKGELAFVDGSIYQGQFEGGVFQGVGSLFYYNGDVYHGEFRQGVATGKGLYTTRDGISYEGDFYQGNATGNLNVIDRSAGSTYMGAMHQWRFSGYGEYKTENSDYQGQFIAGLYHGIGRLKNEYGEYTGQFKEGIYDGLGSYLTTGGTLYNGQFSQGKFSGYGKLTTDEKAVYIGEFKEWALNGHGKYISPTGDIYIGEFVEGYLTGKGKFIGMNGTEYRGDFNNGQFEGAGVLTKSDGEKYKGEFSYGRYHGKGRLEKPGDNLVEVKIKQGTWQYGKLTDNELTGVNLEEQPEIALEQHSKLLSNAIADLKPSDPNKRNIYFLGVGGDGTQSVFRKEVEYVSKQIDDRFDIKGRSLHLINDHETANKYPLATTRSFTKSVNAIAEKMDKENDVFFLYITSHGSQDFQLSIGHDSIQLPDLSATKLKETLQASGIKWKVIIVSACYAGGFIPVLDDETSLIMTAADSENPSFGCSDDSTLTYFGKALFHEVLAKDSQINFKDAFYKAKEIIDIWEKEEELPASNPSIKEQQDVINFLQSMSN